MVQPEQDLHHQDQHSHAQKIPPDLTMNLNLQEILEGAAEDHLTQEQEEDLNTRQKLKS